MELKKEHYIEFLGECFYIISQHCYFATWMNNVEYNLWKLLQHKDRGKINLYYGGHIIGSSLLKILDSLSTDIDGWVTWDDKKVHPVYVKLSEWIPLYEKWEKARIK